MAYISDRITELYKKRNMTVQALAEEVNVSVAGFHNSLKSGDFRLSVLYKIAEALGVDILYFFLTDDQLKDISDKDSKERIEELKRFNALLKSSINEVCETYIDKTDDINSWVAIAQLVKKLEKLNIIDSYSYKIRKKLIAKISDDVLAESEVLKKLITEDDQLLEWISESLSKLTNSEFMVFNEINSATYIERISLIYRLLKSPNNVEVPKRIEKKLHKTYNELKSAIKTLIEKHHIYKKLAESGLLDELF